MIERKSHSILDCFVEVAALFVLLSLIAQILLGPLTTFSYKSELLTQIFRYTASLTFSEKRGKRNIDQAANTDEVPPISELEGDELAAAHMKWDFKHAKPI